jgi:acetyl esterase/lipase
MELMSDEFGGPAEFNGPAFPWNNYEVVHKWNPARPDLLKNWKHAPPTLVIHSDNDYRCPMTDGLAVFKTLQYLGVKSRLLNFPDENHFVLKPGNSRVWHETIFDWINKYSGVTEEREKSKEQAAAS